MHASIRTLLIGLAVLVSMTGCTTPAKRAREHAGAFKRLSPEDQRLVLKGRVRKGLDREVVFIAWGEPDTKTKFSNGRGEPDPKSKLTIYDSGGAERNGEEWTYAERFTIRAPMGSEDQWAPGHPLAAPGGPLLLGSAFGGGGPGHDGWLLNRPRVLESGFTRTAVFVNGQLDKVRLGNAPYSFP